MTPNFILLPHPDPIAIFWCHFPHLKGTLNCEEGDGEYLIYDAFVDYLLEQPLEDAIWQGACALINELAAKNHPTTDTVIRMEIFLALSRYPAAIEFLHANLNGLALQLLEEEMEDEFSDGTPNEDQTL